MNISKELLSEVLGFNVTYVETCTQTIKSRIKSDVSDSDIAIHDGNSYRYINIHELAHKCKEWADSKGYTLNSWIADFTSDKILGWCELRDERTGKSIKECPIVSDNTEPEAVFKACQWILENKETK